MNALVLSRRGAVAGTLTDDTRTALDLMWALQMRTGPETGAWTWLNLGLDPCESPNSRYFGAAMAALAIGSAPRGYAGQPAMADRVQALGAYVQRRHDTVSLLNQPHGHCAASRLPGLVTDKQRRATIHRAFAAQQADGGWSTLALGGYTRVDGSESDARTDGYATAVATQALQSAGVPATDARVVEGLDSCGARRTAPAAAGWPCRPASSVIRSRTREGS